MTAMDMRELGAIGGRAAAEKSAAELMAFKEERDFLRSFGWDDRRIAERFGIAWDAYRRRFQRHPELGEIYDPVDAEMKAKNDFLRAVGAVTGGSKRRTSRG